MITRIMLRSWTRAAGLLAAVLIIASVTGCRTARLASGGGSPPLVDAAGAPGDLARRPADPTEWSWVKTKATFERGGLSDSSWLATAAPAPGSTDAGASGGSGEDLVKESQNPIASLISLPLQNNTAFGIGPHDRTQNTLNIQPVVPLSLGREWSLVNRAIIPIVHQPDTASESRAWDGVGDINLTSFVVAPPMGKFMVGAGPIILFPTASDEHVGNGAWGVGPSAIVVATPGKWVTGLLVSNIWGLEAGGGQGNLEGQEEEQNSFLAQYFVNYNLPNNWFLVSAPIITADWNKPSDDRWVVPFGGGIGRVFTIGKQAVNASAQAYYNVITPDGGPEWSLRLQFTMLFPKK